MGFIDDKETPTWVKIFVIALMALIGVIVIIALAGTYEGIVGSIILTMLKYIGALIVIALISKIAKKIKNKE